MDEDSLNQFLSIDKMLRKKIYSIQMPEAIILDLDSTLLDAYGKQEGRAFNFHYQSNGYHLLRGDSGFATPELYKQCEENGTGYVIRLKENSILREKGSFLVDELDEMTRKNKVDYAVVYDEFLYQAGPWSYYERRVVCKLTVQLE